jgi:hypothetical protein
MTVVTVSSVGFSDAVSERRTTSRKAGRRYRVDPPPWWRED